MHAREYYFTTGELAQDSLWECVCSQRHCTEYHLKNACLQNSRAASAASAHRRRHRRRLRPHRRLPSFSEAPPYLAARIRRCAPLRNGGRWW